jgi:hypothetical protein
MQVSGELCLPADPARFPVLRTEDIEQALVGFAQDLGSPSRIPAGEQALSEDRLSVGDGQVGLHDLLAKHRYRLAREAIAAEAVALRAFQVRQSG